MSLLRLLFLIGIIYVIYLLVRKFANKSNSSATRQEVTSMVRCSYCDVYIVKKDAYFRNNNYYCDADHYDKGTKRS